jgi:hypothetical protein
MPGWAEVRFTGCVIWMRTMKKVCKQEALAYWEALIYTLAVTNMQLDICCSFFGINFKRQGFANGRTTQGMILGTSAFVYRITSAIF